MGRPPPAHHDHPAVAAFVPHDGGRVVNTPGIGGRLPTYRFITLKSAMIAAWFMVIEQRLHICPNLWVSGRSRASNLVALPALARVAVMPAMSTKSREVIFGSRI